MKRAIVAAVLTSVFCGSANGQSPAQKNQDETKVAIISPPEPIGSPADWFPTDSYPAAARRAGEQGRVGFTLDIDETGRVVGCAVVMSSGSATLDAATCPLARANARFKPAQTPDGKPIKATWARATRWALEQVALIDATSFSQVGRIDVSAIGEQLSCKETRTGPVPLTIMGLICDTFKEPAILLILKGPFRDERAIVTLQTSLVMAGDPGFPEEYKLAKQTLVTVARASFDITADGSVINCRVIESQTLYRPFEICLRPLAAFVPLPAGIDGKLRSAELMIGFSAAPVATK